jgi:DNA repair exonuclease SbcCD ATPase subunit
MIEFERVGWWNFLGTGNDGIEIDLKAANSTAVLGVNGRGKSTMIDALSYGLFGTPHRDVKIGQLINSINKKKMLVEIAWKFKGKEYLIRRGMKPKVFEVFENGVLKNQNASPSQYQEVLEGFLGGLNKRTFPQIVALGARYIPFMSLETKERRSIVEDILDIKVFGVMNGLLSDKLKVNRKALAAVEAELSVAENTFALLKENQDKLSESSGDKIIELTAKIAEVSDEISSTKDLATKTRAQAKTILNDIGTTAAWDIKKSEQGELVGKLRAKSSLDKAAVEFYRDNDNCPTCHQEIEEAFRKDEIATKTAKLAEYEAALVALASMMREANVKIEQINKEVTRGRSLLHQADLKDAEAVSLSRTLQSLNDRLVEEGKTIDEDDVKRLVAAGSAVVEIKGRHHEIQYDKAILEATQSVLKDDGAKALIIKQYVPLINQYANKFLEEMDFFVAFELDEMFNETVKSRHRDEFSYHSFSNGQKMRIDYALLFTWREIARRRNSLSTNLLILDEVFDASLDTLGCEDLFKLIKAMGSDTNVFVMTHRGESVSDQFDRTLTFETVGNFSTVTEG